MKHTLLFPSLAALLFVLPQGMQAQPLIVTSTTNPSYDVIIGISPASLVNKVCSPGSFSYQPLINYDVLFIPNTAPALNYLNGILYCSGGNSSFSLPTGGGSGSVTGTATTYSGAVACSAATPSAISCNYYQLSMSGQGISARVIFTSVASTALPISILRFDARKDGRQVYLVWETAAKEAASPITLEQSSDGASWAASTAAVISRPASKSLLFEAREALPASGYRYYRLSQTEADGSRSYSNTLAVRADADLSTVAIVPNPVVSSKLRIDGLEDAAAWEVSVFNMASQMVFHQDAATAELTLPNMAPGLYVLQLSNRETGAGKALRFRKD